jgi:hypothetical protein
MNPTRDESNPLKETVRRIDLPAGLAAAIRSQIHSGELSIDLQRRLRRAVENQPVPTFLEGRIRARLAGAQPLRDGLKQLLPSLIPVAVTALALVGFSIAYQNGYLRWTASSRQSYIASVSTQVSTLMRVGLGDHIHCAVFRKYPKNAPTADEFVKDMPMQYAGLIPIVRSQVPGTYRMTLAHQCVYEGRTFTHLSLMNGQNMMSLMITRKRAGETFQTENVLPALNQAGILLYEAGVQPFQLSAFESGDYLVYFISDLSKQQNTEFMLALAPRVRALVAQL